MRDPENRHQTTNRTEDTTSRPNTQVSARDPNRNSPPGKVQASSRNIKKRLSPKQRIPKAAIQAAKTARNPAQDLRNRKQEVIKQGIHICQKAQKYLSRGQRWRHTPASRSVPPRDPNRSDQVIHYQKRLDPVIAHQQVQRRQNFQEQTLHALSKAIRAI